MENTKGEWRFRPKQFNRKDAENNVGSIEAYNKDDDLASRFVCTVEDVANSEEENLANARLIASAPDLYEALKGILPELKEYVQEVGNCDHSVGICFCGLFNKIDNIEQALVKAESK